ncbi:unnamed protein product [Trypanosoma congolense IL3000]|uniref:WGS project CAEQ00000000 data, annotated contig 36 n=1 Tax=Trypanosoma congolense (strain IL3000) TaxID=1068625 RepID=F9WF99_TRYCI|nr:unnamed protein product [Trypanosoma congolense IL3000]
MLSVKWWKEGGIGGAWRLGNFFSLSGEASAQPRRNDLLQIEDATGLAALYSREQTGKTCATQHTHWSSSTASPPAAPHLCFPPSLFLHFPFISNVEPLYLKALIQCSHCNSVGGRGVSLVSAFTRSLLHRDKSFYVLNKSIYFIQWTRVMHDICDYCRFY